MKIGVLFSGQGSQYNGMGQELYNKYPLFQEIVDQADAHVDFPLKEIMFNDDMRINETRYAQAIIYVMSYATFKLVSSLGVTPAVYCGLSLGEYTALSAANYFSYLDTLELLVKRGELMQAVADKTPTAMLAVIGKSLSEVEKVIEEIEDFCEIANINTYDQIIIGGTEASLAEFMKKCDAKRMIPLKVSGAFHTSALDDAKAAFTPFVNELTVANSEELVLSNYTGTYHNDNLKLHLQMQMTNRVRFCENIEKMIQDGVDVFIEFGPKKTLSTFVKSISKKLGAQVSIYNIEDLKSLEKTLGGVNDVKG